MRIVTGNMVLFASQPAYVHATPAAVAEQFVGGFENAGVGQALYGGGNVFASSYFSGSACGVVLHARRFLFATLFRFYWVFVMGFTG